MTCKQRTAIKLEEYKKKLKDKFNILNVDELNEVERLAIDNYVLASASFEDYLANKTPPKSRQIIAWTKVVLLLIIQTILCYMFYVNDPEVWLLFGWPFMFLKESRLAISYCLLLNMMIAFGQIALLINEARH